MGQLQVRHVEAAHHRRQQCGHGNKLGWVVLVVQAVNERDEADQPAVGGWAGSQAPAS